MNVIVTGASRGIGLELTNQALEKGFSVLAIARKPEQSKPLLQLRERHEKQLRFLAVELTEPHAGERLFTAAKEWPQVDILINNAGILKEGETTEDLLMSFHVNSVSPFLITKALLPLLKKAKNPKVVQITSKMGSIADSRSGGHYAYRASKAALNMINKCLSVDNPWLTTIVMHPGWVQTDMGGATAPTSTLESAQGIWNEINDLKNDDSGKFFDFKGQELPW